MHLVRNILLPCLLMALSLSRASADLTINLDFSNFDTSAPADGHVILGGATRAQAQSVIGAAGTYWESVFASSSSSLPWATGGNLTQDISVGWASHGGSTLATGGTGWFLSGDPTVDGSWAGNASLTWDNDGSSTFFVDTTPFDNSEWNQSSERDITFEGVSMNAERVHYDAPAGSTARDNTDMLSVAIHEIGHALGFLGTFPAFAASDTGSDNDIDITSGVFAGAEIPILGGHTDFELLTPAGGDFPNDPGGGSFFNQFDYGPNVMSPGIVGGTRKLLTEADIAITAQFLGFDMSTVNFNPNATAVPEPSGIVVLALGVCGIAYRRRRKVATVA